MQATSALYNTIFAGVHSTEAKVVIEGTTYGKDKIISLRTSKAAFGEASPEMGLAVSGELELVLYETSANIPSMAEIEVFERIFNTSQQSEWIPKGTYYIDQRDQSSEGIITIYGFDAMLMADRSQPASVLDWPARDIDVVTEIAGIMGIAVDSRTTAIMTGNFQIPMPAQYTMRETLQYIAALYGGSFIISDDNKLRLVGLWNVSSSAVSSIGDSVFSVKKGDAFAAVSGITFVLDDETEVSAGTDTGYVFEIQCPWATSAAAALLLAQFANYTYQPFSADGAIINPACEIGDTISLYQHAGTPFLAGLFYERITHGVLYTSNIAAPNSAEIDHEYHFESAETRRFERRLKNMQSELIIQAAQISAKVSSTGGAASSFGWSLDAEGFSLMSESTEVFRADEDGLSIQGTVTATAGSIGGCSIENGTLHIANANIDNINASKINAGTLSVARIASKSITGAKIQDETLASTKMADGAAVNRVIGSQAVSYAKTSFQGTLDQVGTNAANIDTIYGYFTGSASFSALNATTFWLNGYQHSNATVPINGLNMNLVTWGAGS